MIETKRWTFDKSLKFCLPFYPYLLIFSVLCYPPETITRWVPCGAFYQPYVSDTFPLLFLGKCFYVYKNTLKILIKIQHFFTLYFFFKTNHRNRCGYFPLTGSAFIHFFVTLTLLYFYYLPIINYGIIFFFFIVSYLQSGWPVKEY